MSDITRPQLKSFAEVVESEATRIGLTQEQLQEVLGHPRLRAEVSELLLALAPASHQNVPASLQKGENYRFATEEESRIATEKSYALRMIHLNGRVYFAFRADSDGMVVLMQ